METVAVYYVRSRGHTTGPFDVAALQELVRRGRVSRFDQVSTDKTQWRPATDLPSLFVSRRNNPTTNAAEPDDDPREAVALRGDESQAVRAARPLAGAPVAYAGWAGDGPRAHVVGAAQFAAKVTYVVAAAITIIFTLLPITVSDGQPVWWWDAPAWAIFDALYALAASIALLIVTPLTGRLTRPLVALALIGAPLLVAFLASFVGSVDHGGAAVLAVFAGWGLTVTLLVLACLNRLRLRLKGGGPPSVRVAQVIVGSITVLAALAGIGWLALARSNEPASEHGLFIVGVYTSWVGIVAVLAAGVIALIGGKPAFTPALIGASTGAIVTASALFAIGAVAVLGGVHLRGLLGPNGVATVYTLLRATVLLTASVAWFSAALRELLTWIYRFDALDVR